MEDYNHRTEEMKKAMEDNYKNYLERVKACEHKNVVMGMDGIIVTFFCNDCKSSLVASTDGYLPAYNEFEYNYMNEFSNKSIGV